MEAKVIYTDEIRPQVIGFEYLHAILRTNLPQTQVVENARREVLNNYESGFLTENEYHAQSVIPYVDEYKEIHIYFDSSDDCKGCEFLPLCKGDDLFIIGGEIGSRSKITDPIPKPRKGMLVNVYSDGSDCTNGGITTRHKRLIMVGKGIPEIFEAKADGSDCIEYVERFMFGKDCNICVPLDKPEGMNGPMFGGRFVYTSDSRFPSDAPIPVHDRFESW